MAVATERLLLLLPVRCPRRRWWTCSQPCMPSSSRILFTSFPGVKLTPPRRRLRPLFSGRDDDNLQPSDIQPLKNAKLNSEFFVKWEVPWDGKTVIVTMTAFGLRLLSCVSTMTYMLKQRSHLQQQSFATYYIKSSCSLAWQYQFCLLDLASGRDNFWTLMSNLFSSSSIKFVSLQTFAGTSVIKACLNNYSPFPTDLFNYDWRDPFSLNRGWLLWSVVGVFCGTAAVLLAGTLTTYINGEPLPREGQDALLQLLPLIGASSTSTALLLTVTGILAPYLEETVFRGFLMTSLTKWVPTYAAVILSAGAFALAHFTPGEIPQLFALGVVLGFSYSKSGNLLTPIVIHGMWNSGVLLLLTFLRLQGYDIQELI